MRSQLAATPLTEFAYMTAPVGWDSDMPPQFMPEQYAAVLDNFIPRNGKLTLRQPFSTQLTSHTNGNWASTGMLNIRGYAGRANGNLILSAPTQFQANQPQYNNDEGLWVMQAGRTSTSIWYGASLATDNVWEVQDSNWFEAPLSGSLGALPPGKSYATLYARVYWVTPPTSVGGLGTNGGDCHLIEWNSTAGYADISTVSGCPRSCTAAYAYQSRLWVLGGYFNGDLSTTYSSNALMFTNPLKPADDPKTSGFWHYPISGAENNLFVNPDVSDPALGLASFNQRLIIFRYNSVYILTGSTPANYSVQLLSDTVGCVDQQSIVETGQGVYFVSAEGLQITTGTSVTNVSGQVQESLAAAVQKYRQGVGSGGTGDCTAAKLLNGDILITIRLCANGSIANTAGFDTIWSGVFSPTTMTWYRVSSNLFGNGDASPTALGVDCLPAYVIRGNGGVLSVGNKRGVVIEGPGKPAMASTDVAPKTVGLSGYPLISGMDIQSLTSTTANAYPIPARWISSFVPLAPSGRFHSTGVRWYADYLLQQDSTPSGSGDVGPFTVRLLTVSGATITTLSLPPAANQGDAFPGPYATQNTGLGNSLARAPLVQRADADFREEMEHAVLIVEFAPSGTPWSINSPWLLVAEILGIGIEFQQGRNLENLTT